METVAIEDEATMREWCRHRFGFSRIEVCVLYGLYALLQSCHNKKPSFIGELFMFWYGDYCTDPMTMVSNAA